MGAATVSARVLARKRLRVSTILLTSSLAFLAPSAIAPGLPALQEDFSHVENSAFLSPLVLTMPMLFIALASPFAGYAIDRYGRRNLLIASTVLYGLTGVSGLFMGSIVGLLVSRAFLGVFLAGIMTSVTALVGDYFVGEERNRVAGLQGAFMSLGTLTFVVIAGVLAEIHWRVGFTLFAVAFLLLPLMFMSLYEPDRSDTRDVSGLEPPPTLGQWTVIGLICGLAFVTLIFMFMIPSQTAFFLAEIGVEDPTRAGLAIGLFNLSAGIASLGYSRLRTRLSAEAIFALLLAIGGLGYVLTGLSDSFTGTMIAMGVGGFSMGAFLPNINLAIISRTSMAVRGRALGALTTSFFLGQFLSPVWAVPISTASSVGNAFVVSGYLLIVMSVCFLLVVVYQRLR
ncbi:MAG: MFS transporter [Alphaproteobacteria bacterium]|nr:MFS transporter [Alphaproteobacteria bacterium]